MSDSYLHSIVAVLGKSGRPVGTGFVVDAPGHSGCLIITCYHVAALADRDPDGCLTIRFHNSGEERRAYINPEWCRSKENADVAILTVEGQEPSGIKRLHVGSSAGACRHKFDTFGFPSSNRDEGLHGPGEIIGGVTFKGCKSLQLSSNVVTRGFSGAPVWDRQRQRVLGVIRDIAIPDEFSRLGCTALATSAEVFAEICPALQLSDTCPYLGLSAFEEKDARLFKGRTRVIDRLVSRLQQNSRLLLVLGPSGSGKSSVVQAGLIPRLRAGQIMDSDNWGILIARPGDDPFSELAKAGLPTDQGDLASAVDLWLNEHHDQTRLVLVLDQFEDIFLGQEDSTIQRLLQELGELLTRESSNATVVLVLRADFYGRLLNTAPTELIEMLDHATANVAWDLGEDEVRAIINEPAEETGFAVDSGLTELIVRDMHQFVRPSNAVSEFAPSPRLGATAILPLLEHCLKQLWTKRIDGEMKQESYRDVGGLGGSIGEWAENAYMALSPGDRPLAWRVLSTLVHAGDNEKEIPTSRQRLLLSTLCAKVGERESVERIVKHFAHPDVRLLVTDVEYKSGETTVELIHDAVLDRWPRFRKWLQKATSSGFLAWRGRMEPLVEQWVDLCPEKPKRRKRPDFGGRNLVEAEGWLESAGNDLLPAERQFIQAAIARRRSQRGLAVLTGLVVVLILVWITYSWQRRDAAAKLMIESAKLKMDDGEFNSAREILGRTQFPPVDLFGRSQDVRVLNEGLSTVEEFESVRLKHADSFDHEATVRRFAEVFRRLHIDLLNGDVDEIVSKVTQSPIRQAQIGAFDECAALCQAGSIWHNITPEKKAVFERQRDRFLELGQRCSPQDEVRSEICRLIAVKDLEGLQQICESGGDRISPSQFKCVAYYLPQNYRTAVLRKGQATHPTDFWANFTLGVYLQDLGTRRQDKSLYLEAAGFYRTAIAIRPRIANVHTNLGSVLNSAGLSDQAKDSLVSAIDLGANNGRARSNLSSILLFEGSRSTPQDFHKAANMAREAIRVNPNLIDAHTNLSTILYFQGDFTEAIKAIHETIRLAKEQHVEHRHYVVQLVNILIDRADSPNAPNREKDLIDALDLVNKQDLSEDSVGLPTGDVRFDHRFLRGRIYFVQERFDEALREFQEAAHTHPNSSLAHQNVGVTWERLYVQDQTPDGKLQKLEQLHASFSRSLQTDPANQTARHMLGWALLQQGRCIDAENLLSRVTEKESYYFENLSNLGVARMKQDKLQAAEDTFRMALTLSEDLKAGKDIPKTTITLGDSLYQQGRFDEAINCFDDADLQETIARVKSTQALLEEYADGVNPTQQTRQLLLAKVLHYCGRHDEAHRIYSEAYSNLAEREVVGDQNRYYAACSAIFLATRLADEDKIEDATRRQLLESAHAHLDTKLASLEKIDPDNAAFNRVREELNLWLGSPKLAGVREEDSLIALPDPVEGDWRVLWAKVRSLAGQE